MILCNSLCINNIIQQSRDLQPVVGTEGQKMSEKLIALLDFSRERDRDIKSKDGNAMAFGTKCHY